MSAFGNSKNDWQAQADAILRQISTNRMDMNKLFPVKEHLQIHMKLSNEQRKNLNKFYSKPLDSLVTAETIQALLKQGDSIEIPQSDRTYSRLKKLYQETLMILMTAKSLVKKQTITYTEAKFTLGELYDLGIIFSEADVLKKVMDDNRGIEQNLCETYLSLEELQQLEADLILKSDLEVDVSFRNIIQEKKKEFHRLEDSLDRLLQAHHLSPDSMKQVCLILDEAEQLKFKLKDFKYVCGIRDSFRWVHIIDLFLDSNDYTIDTFSILMRGISKVDITRPINLEVLKHKLTRLIKLIEKHDNVSLFKAIIAPVKDVTLTDQSIIDIIEFVTTSKWTFDTNKSLGTNDMTIEDLGELLTTVPEIKKKMKDDSYLKIRNLFENAVDVDNRVKNLVKELNTFIESQQQLSDLKNLDQNLLSHFYTSSDELSSEIVKNLAVIKDFRTSKELPTIKALLQILSIGVKLAKSEEIIKEDLSKLKSFLSTLDISSYKKNPVLSEILKFYSENSKVIRFFERLKENSILDMDMRDDIIVVRQYKRIISGQNDCIDYADEVADLDIRITEFEGWEQKVEKLVKEYDFDDIEQDYQNFIENRSDSLKAEIEALKLELKNLSFKSLAVEKLDVLRWCVDALVLLLGPKQKMNVWQSLLSQSKKLNSIPFGLRSRFNSQIDKAEDLVLHGHEIYKDQANYKDIRTLKVSILECPIDMSEELSVFQERFTLEQNLSTRITEVLENKIKMRFMDIEKLCEDLKNSGIDFDDEAFNLNKTVQVCKAFTIAIKEMKKSPVEIKRAKQTYKMLPLASPTFDGMLEKLEEEETIIEQMDDIIKLTEEDHDFERLAELESLLNQAKYYQFEEEKLRAFMLKLKILKHQSERTELRFVVSYVVIKSLKLQAEQYLLLYKQDKELQLYCDWLTQVDKQIKDFLDSLQTIKNIKTFEKIKKVILNVIDISSEISDLENKCRLNIQRTSNLFSIKDKVQSIPVAKGDSSFFASSVAKSDPVAKKFQLTIGDSQKTLIKPIEPLKEGKSQFAGSRPLNQGQDLNQHSTLTTTKKIATPNVNPIKFLPEGLGLPAETLQNQTKEVASQTITELRNYLLSLLMKLLSTNLYLVDFLQPQTPQQIEKFVFQKSNRATYEQKMRKILQLFDKLRNLKKLSMIVGGKQFDMDLVIFLMTKDQDKLEIYEKNKNELLTDMGFGHILPKRSLQESEHEEMLGKRTSPEEDDVERIRGEKPLTPSRIAGIMPPKFDDEIQDEKEIGVSFLTSFENSAQQFSSKRFNLDEFQLGGHEAAQKMNFGMANQSGGKSGAKKKEIELLSNTDIFSEEIKIRKKIENEIEDSTEPDLELFKQVIRASQGEGKNIGEQKLVQTAEHDSCDSYKIYSGDLVVDLQVQSQAPAQVQQQMQKITLESSSLIVPNYSRSKNQTSNGQIIKSENTGALIRTIPALDKTLVLRGSLSMEDFKDYVQKSAETNTKFTSYLLGFLQVDPQSELTLKKIFNSDRAAYFVKYNPFCKLLLFPRSLLDKAWVTQIGADIKTIIGVKNYQFRFLILFNKAVLASQKYGTPIFFDPMPIFEESHNFQQVHYANGYKDASTTNLYQKSLTSINPLDSQQLSLRTKIANQPRIKNNQGYLQESNRDIDLDDLEGEELVMHSNKSQKKLSIGQQGSSLLSVLRIGQAQAQNGIYSNSAGLKQEFAPQFDKKSAVSSQTREYLNLGLGLKEFSQHSLKNSTGQAQRSQYTLGTENFKSNPPFGEANLRKNLAHQVNQSKFNPQSSQGSNFKNSMDLESDVGYQYDTITQDAKEKNLVKTLNQRQLFQSYQTITNRAVNIQQEYTHYSSNPHQLEDNNSMYQFNGMIQGYGGEVQKNSGQLRRKVAEQTLNFNQQYDPRYSRIQLEGIRQEANSRLSKRNRPEGETVYDLSRSRSMSQSSSVEAGDIAEIGMRNISSKQLKMPPANFGKNFNYMPYQPSERRRNGFLKEFSSI